MWRARYSAWPSRWAVGKCHEASTIASPGARGYAEYFAFFNLDSKPATLRATWKELGLDNGKHTAEDEWTMESGKPSKDFTVTLPAHGSTVIEVQ